MPVFPSSLLRKYLNVVSDTGPRKYKVYIYWIS